VDVMTTLQQRLPGAASLAQPETPRKRFTRALNPARTPAGVTLALALAAGLGLTAAELVAALMGTPLGWIPLDRVLAVAGRTTWWEISFAALVPVIGGSGLLALAIVPGRSRLVPVETADPLIVIGITRSGLRRTLRAVAQNVDGVARARVRLRKRAIEVTVTTGSESSGAMLRQVGTAVGDRLAGLGAICAGEVVVRLRTRGL
ncbi:DUF6286 domain-containing protein, partial [Nonomuraea sp. NPDC059022]|uniref:DUF6286 domain-containing protein n=1 Tax=Nonomuraea sp. NPDC059022 TaxID=3346705 RepID=UPI0036BFE210